MNYSSRPIKAACLIAALSVCLLWAIELAALSCSSPKPERLIVEIVSVTIDGEPVEAEALKSYKPHVVFGEFYTPKDEPIQARMGGDVAGAWGWARFFSTTETMEGSL